MVKKIRKKKAKRGAQISQKMKKPLGQAGTNYNKLQEKTKTFLEQQGLSTDDMSFIEPPDKVKMSDVILKLAEPLLKKYRDSDNRIKAIISLTILEWSKLMFPDSEQEELQDMTIDNLIPADGNAEDVASLIYISDLISERKQKYFPEIRKVILSYDLNVVRGDITLSISSAPIP